MDSRVRTIMTTEGEVEVMRGIQDMGAGTKRKGDQPSSSSGKKAGGFGFARVLEPRLSGPGTS